MIVIVPLLVGCGVVPLDPFDPLDPLEVPLPELDPPLPDDPPLPELDPGSSPLVPELLPIVDVPPEHAATATAGISQASERKSIVSSNGNATRGLPNGPWVAQLAWARWATGPATPARRIRAWFRGACAWRAAC